LYEARSVSKFPQPLTLVLIKHIIFGKDLGEARVV
jgi:hypothetical protein